MVSGPSSSMSSANPFSNFGITDLLGDSCEDDETFRAHFSENLAESRAELEKNPLTFPIPPSSHFQPHPPTSLLLILLNHVTVYKQ